MTGTIANQLGCYALHGPHLRRSVVMEESGRQTNQHLQHDWVRGECYEIRLFD